MTFLFRSQHYHSNNHLHHHRHNQRLLIACCFDFNIDHRGPSRDFQEVFCQQGSFKRPGCVLCSCPWFCCDIKHQSWELCSLASASIGPVATSTSLLSCFRIRVPFYLCATWFFMTFQTLTSETETLIGCDGDILRRPYGSNIVLAEGRCWIEKGASQVVSTRVWRIDWWPETGSYLSLSVQNPCILSVIQGRLRWWR